MSAAAITGVALIAATIAVAATAARNGVPRMPAIMATNVDTEMFLPTLRRACMASSFHAAP